jgi:hypothetical protein
MDQANEALVRATMMPPNLPSLPDGTVHAFVVGVG